MRRTHFTKTLILSFLFSLALSGAAFANPAFEKGDSTEISSDRYIKTGNSYYDTWTGCTYEGAEVAITAGTEAGQHFASSGQGSSSSDKITWIIAETATSKIWIPKGTTKESTDIYIQDGHVYKKVPGKWTAKKPDETDNKHIHVDGKDSEPGYTEEWDVEGGRPDTDKDSGKGTVAPEEQKNPEGDGDSGVESRPSQDSETSRVDNITNITIGDLEINGGTISGEWTIPDGSSHEVSITPGEDGEWVSKTITDEDSNVEIEISAKYEGLDTELEDYWYTFTGENLDNALISSDQAHTNFGIGPKQHRQASFRSILTIPGTWLVDCTYWEQLGIYKTYTVRSGPDENGDYSETTKRKKIDTKITSEPERPGFPQYVPVPLVCTDCPPIEICVNGACDCVDSSNTVCSNIDREEAEKQLDTYDMDAHTQLEK